MKFKFDHIVVSSHICPSMFTIGIFSLCAVFCPRCWGCVLTARVSLVCPILMCDGLLKLLIVSLV